MYKDAEIKEKHVKKEKDEKREESDKDRDRDREKRKERKEEKIAIKEERQYRVSLLFLLILYNSRIIFFSLCGSEYSQYNFRIFF